jgi:hypothetical protein
MTLRTLAVAATAIVLSTTYSASTSATAMTKPPASSTAASTALDAYIYGYSLITTEVTRVQMSNVPKLEMLRGPMNVFVNVPRYPPASYRGVSAPNADTLYSIAWLDLAEPKVFGHPDMGKRFHLFPMVNLWMTIFASPGTRTGDNEAANYLITGPGWTGQVPAGMKHIKSATRYIVILGRTYADGSEKDYQTVNALQSQFKITPLSKWGNEGYIYKAPPVDENPGFSMTDKPQAVILGLGAAGYFNMMTRLMCKDAPPPPADAPLLERMKTIGIEPCKPFDATKLDAATQATLPKLALEKMNKAQDKSMGTIVDGWVITKGLGVYGTNYLKRAVVAAFGWPANLEEDAVYPYTEVDAAGQKLSGANSYTLTFPKGQTPPVNGFWSVTMYEIDQGWWFVPNPLNKFTVSPRNNLIYNADGSLTLYFQNTSPGQDKETNWLPAPKGEFIPMLRMYWPKDTTPSILNGTWTPPGVMKVG